MNNIRRVPTGVPGFDNLIQGGFYPGSLNMISGGPGTGKTIFALQFIYYGAISYGDRGIYISFEQTKEDLIEDARSFNWDFEQLEKLNRAKIIFHSPYDLKKFSDNLIDEIRSFQAKRVVFDSSSVLGLAMGNSYEVRKFLFEMQRVVKKTGVTALLTAEVTESGSIDSSGGGSLSRFGVEEFISDSVTTLHYGGLGGDTDRMIRVLKIRRTKQKRDLIPMHITDDGIIVNFEPEQQEADLSAIGNSEQDFQ